MPAGYGFGGHIGLAKESSWGTATAATDFVEGLSESVAASFDRYDVKNIVGRYGEPDDEQGLKRIGGDVVFAGQPEAMLPWMVAATGIQSGTEILSGFLHQHDLTMATSEDGANNPLAPLTLEIFRDVTSSQQYDGCQVSQLQMSAAPNQDLRLTASVIGKGERNIAKTTATFPGSPTGPFTFDTCSISIAGAASAKVEGFTLTIDNQLEGIPTLNASAEIAKVRRTGPQLVRLSGSLGFEDIVEYEYFKNETEVAFLANFTAASSHSLLIDIPRLIYTAFPTGIGDRGRQVISFDGICRWHAGSLSAIAFALTNTTSGF
jgi:hypothetical protein